MPNIGIYFEKLSLKTEGILEFPDSVSHKILHEIQNFWNREHLYRQYKLNYRRGVICYGTPGSGKSSLFQLVSRDVIGREGIVINFSSPGIFGAGIRKLREIQPATPVVVLMEDIDSLISHYSETEILNILDGVEKFDKIVFLASTNYPENLGARIMNRPSRFDKRFKIGYLNEESRKYYFTHLINGQKDLDIDVDKWAKDTENLTIAHLKELFSAVVIFWRFL